ncbi:hypothetical protein CR513_52442, partial [Mucuna pruriens]
MKYGCSTMLNGWTNRNNRMLINFLLNCSLGTMLYIKLLNSFVEEIGEKNTIQVVTDNRSNYVMVGKLLQATRTKLFWTPYATHHLDLMLKDIGKIAKVKKVIQRAYIYNHSLALNTMRKFTNKSELVRHEVIRFAIQKGRREADLSGMNEWSLGQLMIFRNH